MKTLIYLLQVDPTSRFASYTASYILMALSVVVLLICLFNYLNSREKSHVLAGTGKLSLTGVPAFVKHYNTSEVKPAKEVTLKKPILQKEVVKQNALPEKREAIIIPKIPEPAITILPALEKETQTTIKTIGYNPLNIFNQAEPFNYPYVVMPEPGSVIKFPRKGRVETKSYQHEDFKKYILQYFSTNLNVADDRSVMVKAQSIPLEPAITLVVEKNGINIFMAIEIDEPYESINDTIKRKPTNYQQSNTNRNNYFKNRGWIVVRFAEIQVHQHPASCCLYIADVLKSIYPAFDYPKALQQLKTVLPVAQWTKAQAEKYSVEKYRETYLGIEQFDAITVARELTATETLLGEEIEKQVVDETPIIFKDNIAPETPVNIMIITARIGGQCLSFLYGSEPILMKPLQFDGRMLTGYCYIKNENRKFELQQISLLKVKEKPFILEMNSAETGEERIRDIITISMRYNRFVRMCYDKGEVRSSGVEKGVRTISSVASISTIADQPQKSVTAFCNGGDEQRTFELERIREIAILNI